MQKLRTLLLLLALALCLSCFFACDNGSSPDAGDDGDGDGGQTSAPDAPSSRNEYGDNVVDYDSLFGGNENE